MKKSGIPRSEPEMVKSDVILPQREVKAQAGMNAVECCACRLEKAQGTAFFSFTMLEIARMRVFLAKVIKAGKCNRGHKIEVAFH